jgi:FlgN protein
MTPARPAPISPALKPVVDLETILADLLVEHRKMLKHLEIHQAAMQELRLPDMEAARRQQEACRARIIALESRRRTQVQQIARINQIQIQPKIPQLIEMYPQRRVQLLKLQGDLRTTMKEVSARSFIASKLASAVLGHLNTAMRILAGAVGGGGVYTQRGTPKMARRIGVMEAVG